MVSAISSASGSSTSYTVTETSSSSSSSHSNSSAGDEILAPTTVAPKKESSNSDDTCAWYSGARCYMPRDCYDCINTAIQRDTCAVDPNGSCVSMTSYYETARRQGGVSDSEFLGYFPSANFTYCASSDDTCAQCKQQWRLQYYSSDGDVPNGETCYGASGCICIATCEMPNRVSKILNSQCGSGSDSTVTGSSHTNVVSYLYLGVALCGALLLGLVVLKAWMRKRNEEARAEARRERRERRRNRPSRTGPKLALTGWNTLRDKLLEDEREFIDGGGKPVLLAPGVQGAAGAAEVEPGDDYVERRNDEDADSDISSDDEEHERRHHRV